MAGELGEVRRLQGQVEALQDVVQKMAEELAVLREENTRLREEAGGYLSELEQGGRVRITMTGTARPTGADWAAELDRSRRIFATLQRGGRR